MYINCTCTAHIENIAEARHFLSPSLRPVDPVRAKGMLTGI